MRSWFLKITVIAFLLHATACNDNTADPVYNLPSSITGELTAQVDNTEWRAGYEVNSTPLVSPVRALYNDSTRVLNINGDRLLATGEAQQILLRLIVRQSNPLGEYRIGEPATPFTGALLAAATRRRVQVREDLSAVRDSLSFVSADNLTPPPVVGSITLTRLDSVIEGTFNFNGIGFTNLIWADRTLGLRDTAFAVQRQITNGQFRALRERAQ
jgi:hypothetical protein